MNQDNYHHHGITHSEVNWNNCHRHGITHGEVNQDNYHHYGITHGEVNWNQLPPPRHYTEVWIVEVL